MTWFKKQDKIIQVLLLFIPFVNWIVELVVRWSSWFKKGDAVRLVICLVVTIFGVFIGILDAIWIIINDELFLE